MTDLSNYVAVRTGAYWLNLYHAARREDRREDGTYTSMCQLNRPLERVMSLQHRGVLPFSESDEAFRCRKCLIKIEKIANPEPPPVPKPRGRPKGPSKPKPEPKPRVVRNYRIADPIKIGDLYDIDLFFHHVDAYRKRHKITIDDLAMIARVSRNTMRPTEHISLRVVLALASVCDLSIDSYRRDPL